MATIPPRFLDEIRSRLPISSVVGARIRITRAGREHKACCPFHQEKTPSFTINDDKGFYHCFGCGAHGDVIGFVMNYDKLTFMEALENLAAQAGLEIPKPSPQDARREQEEKTLYDMMDAACAFFERNLTGSALDYLTNRGVLAKTIKDFHIGLALESNSALIDHLKEKGFKLDQMISCGIARAGKNAKPPYDFFRDRIMFPVTDMKGRIIAFGGRILPENLRAPSFSGFNPPKYINSPDTPLFDKSSTLYAAKQAKIGARAGHSIIIVEGYMDAIACHQNGFCGALAPMGTAITPEQLTSVWGMYRGQENITPVLCMDGDSAGKSAAIRAVKRALPMIAPNKTVKIALLPKGQDPDSLLRSGGKGALSNLINAPKTILDILWDEQTTSHPTKTPEERAGVKARLLDILSDIEDNDVAAHYRAALNDKISKEFFQRRKNGGKFGKNIGQAPRPAVSTIPKTTRIQQRLLEIVIECPQIYGLIEESLAGLEIADPTLSSLRCSIIDTIGSSPNITAQDLGASMRKKGYGKVMDDIARKTVYCRAGFDEWQGLFTQLEQEIEMLEKQHKWHKALHDGDINAEKALRESVAKTRTER